MSGRFIRFGVVAEATTSVGKNKAETAISLSNLNSGAYIYVINKQETKLHQGRLIVIK
jgi:hypothetical protein